MSQSGKDNLENFFRKGAQNHKLDFVENDWLKLKERLDIELPVRHSFWASLRKFWYVLLLLLIPLSWFAFPEIKKSISPELNSGSSNVYKTQEEEEKPVFQEQIEAEGQAISEPSGKPVIQAGKRPIPMKDSPISSVTVQMGARDQRNKDEVKVITSSQDTEYKNDIGYVVSGDGAKFEGQISNDKLHFLSPLLPVFTMNARDMTIATQDITKPMQGKNRNPKPFFSLGVGYSPDFSTVGLGHFVAPGSRWKVLAELTFLKRWALSTGVVMVHNKYEAYGEDYHAPARYWKDGIVASEAYGECKMIDIPLNIRYSVIAKRSHTLFLSAGASTYLVTKEDYYFHYDEYNPDFPSHWGTDKMTKYPFGIINASIGYSYNITKKSAVQIEPFIKIPTTGIGWGKVDLHTIGAYFMYRYRIGN